MSQYSARQLSGTEYGGVAVTRSTVQPKDSDALNNGEQLRLGYLTGVDDDAESFEDHRQRYGLRPASGQRPLWLDNAGNPTNPQLESEARRQGYGSDQGAPILTDPDLPVDV